MDCRLTAFIVEYQRLCKHFGFFFFFYKGLFAVSHVLFAKMYGTLKKPPLLFWPLRVSVAGVQKPLFGLGAAAGLRDGGSIHLLLGSGSTVGFLLPCWQIAFNRFTLCFDIWGWSFCDTKKKKKAKTSFSIS